jgi:hypothetical protein
MIRVRRFVQSEWECWCIQTETALLFHYCSGELRNQIGGCCVLCCYVLNGGCAQLVCH